MSEDTLYLLLCYLIVASTLAWLVVKSRRPVLTLATHGVMMVVYSSILLYSMKEHGSGGTSLLWLVALMGSLGIHWIILLTGIILTYRRKHSYPNDQCA